jgi:hypothetical protein
MKLHRPVAHAGSSGPVDPAGSPACRGWRSGKIKANRTSGDVKYRKTKPRQANQDCRKSCCGSAFNSFGASLGGEKQSHASRRLPVRGRASLPGSPHGVPRNWRQPGRTTEAANRPKQSHRITTQRLSNSSLTMTYIMRGEKSPRGQTQPSWFLHRPEAHEQTAVVRGCWAGITLAGLLRKEQWHGRDRSKTV